MVKDIDKGLVRQLQGLYHDDPAAQTVLDWAAARLNDAKSTRIDRIAYLADLPRHGVIAVARQLEEAKVGKFVPGRRGHPSRIKWFYSLQSLGAAAKSGTDLVAIDETAEDDEGEEAIEVEEGFISHRYQLRPQTAVTINLPADFTKAEAERLATFIQSLPFGS